MRLLRPTSAPSTTPPEDRYAARPTNKPADTSPLAARAYPPPSTLVHIPIAHREDPGPLIKAALRRGYEFVWISEVIAAMEGRGTLPAKAIALTYDDGQAEVMTVAQPVIATYPQVKATMFACSDWLYGNAVDASLSTFNRATWANMRTLRDTGQWEFQNHTKTHPNLEGLSQAAQQAELQACNDAIVAELGVPVPTAVAYPRGFYNAATTAALAAMGFKAGFDYSAGQMGTKRSSRLDQGRYGINRNTDLTADTLRWALDTVFYHCVNEMTGGRNAGDVLGWWVNTGSNVGAFSAGQERGIDSRTDAAAVKSMISADYFRVRPSDVVYSHFYSTVESITAGSTTLRLRQYDAARAELAAAVIWTASAVETGVYREQETALDPACRYIRIELLCDATFNGRVKLKNMLIERAY